MATSAVDVGRPRALLSWSSGKDSAWALHVLRQQGAIEVVGLLTTVNARHGRVAMHAVRRELLETQARATGLPLWPVSIPSPCGNDQYEAAMASVLDRALADGITVMAFGDLFLEDIRRYREERLAPLGISAIFPLWGLPTANLARDMLGGGLHAYVTCVDPGSLSSTADTASTANGTAAERNPYPVAAGMFADDSFADEVDAYIEAERAREREEAARVADA